MPLRLTYASLAVFLILASVGCSRDAARNSDILVDDLGRTIQLDEVPHRVVTLAPSLTEMVYAAGAGEKLIGVGTVDDYPAAVDSLPRYATYPVDFEAIAALQPDLALATDQVNSPRDAETLQALGIPTYFFSFESLDDVFEGLVEVGTLLGSEEAASAAADTLRREVKLIVQQTNTVDDRPRVLFIIGRETLFSFGNESYVHEMIAAAGGQSITEELDVRSPTLSEEFVLRSEPDVIMGPWSTDTTAASLLEHHPTWIVVPAIRSGRIYGIDASLVERPGPRLVEGIRQMAYKLHPSIFADEMDTATSP